MALHSFEELPIVVASYAAAVKKGAAIALRLIATAGSDTIIDATPVDTAKAVTNWRLSKGSPETDIVPEPGYSKKGSGADVARLAAKQNNARAIEETNDGDTTLYLVNNVPYIGLLEYGDDKRTPHAMVSKGLLAMGLTAKNIQVLKSGGKG